MSVSNSIYNEYGIYDKIIIKDDYLLLKLVYIKFYLPKILFYKFELINVLIENNSNEILFEDNIPMIDLTDSFVKHANIEQIDFVAFPKCFYNLCMGHITSFDIPMLQKIKYFLDYIGLDIELMSKFI